MGREGGRERERGREGGRKRGRERGREGGREGVVQWLKHIIIEDIVYGLQLVTGQLLIAIHSYQVENRQ